MSEDARFEDAPLSDRPLRLRAVDADDLAVISSLVQDAVGRIGDIRWMARHRRLVILLNRFRWEDARRAKQRSRPFERVRTALTVNGVMRLRSRGLDPRRQDTVVSVLALGWDAGPDAAGRLVVTFAGGAELRADAEMLDLALADLTRPWEARADEPPRHDT